MHSILLQKVVSGIMKKTAMGREKKIVVRLYVIPFHFFTCIVRCKIFVSTSGFHICNKVYRFSGRVFLRFIYTCSF